MSEAELDQVRLAQREAELNGYDLWSPLTSAISVSNLRSIVRTVPIADLQRATSAIFMIGLAQMMIILIGLPDLAGEPIDLPAPLNRFNGQMIRQMQADPMWDSAIASPFARGQRNRIRGLVLSALGLLLVPGLLEQAAQYELRLRQLTGWGSSHSHLDHL